ncbi:MAG: DUF2605 family protein [Synechococcaceae cyanobacterium ELA739]|jgi:hypothetical protein
MATPPPNPESAGELLEQVLGPLLDDFAASFERGLLLVQNCPETVLPLAAQLSLEGRLLEARAELRAARALRAAAPTPMALDMATIAPWHQLLVEVWSLSSSLRAAGIQP